MRWTLRRKQDITTTNAAEVAVYVDPTAPVALPDSRTVRQFALDMFLVHPTSPWLYSPYRGIAQFLTTVEFDEMGAIEKVSRYAHITKALSGPRQFVIDLVVTCVGDKFPVEELYRTIATLKTASNSRVAWVSIWATSEHYPTGVVRLLPPTPLHKVNTQVLPRIVPLWHGQYDALNDSTGRLDKNDGQPVAVAFGGRDIMFLPLQHIAAATLEFGAHLTTLGGGNLYSLTVIIGAGANAPGAGGTVEDVVAAYEVLDSTTVLFPREEKWKSIFAGADRMAVYAGDYDSTSYRWGREGLPAFRTTCLRLGIPEEQIMVGLDGDKLKAAMVTNSTRIAEEGERRAAAGGQDQDDAEQHKLSGMIEESEA